MAVEFHPDVEAAIRDAARGTSRVVRKSAYVTAIVEARGQNPRGGDRDSLGAFQQRPSQGWGRPDQVMDPKYAAREYIRRAKIVHRQHPEYNSAQIAQAVQRSAYPDRYADPEVQAQGQRMSSAGGGGSAGRGTLGFRGPSSTDVSLQSRTIPGQSFAGERRDLRRDLLLSGRTDFDALLQYKTQMKSLKDIPSRKVHGDLQVTRHPGQKFSVPVGERANGGVRAAGGEVYEVFYDPLGRYFDSGGIRKGAIGGHGTHVHVAGQRELLRSLGKLAQRMGLQVGENSMFGGATPTSGHAEGSFHYKDEAIDVSGGTPAARAKFARIAMQEARRRARASRK